jgi:prolycopene isomerase
MATEKYPLIVIGAGITGLSTAIAFAKNTAGSKKKALVLERHSLVGGMVTTFRRGGFAFDTAQLIPDPGELFRYLDIDVPLRPFKNYYARIFLVKDKGTLEVRIPNGYENFRDMLLERYPEDEKAIRRFFDYSRAMFNELYHLKVEPKLADFARILLKCPKTVRNKSKTFREYVDGFGFTNKELKDVFDVFAAFSGLPAERAIAMMTVAAMNTTLIDSFRPEKGFIELPLAMKKSAEKLGCEVRTRAKVVKILTENGKATGVKLENGEALYADHIVTTADTKLAMKELVGLDVLRQADAKYAEKVEQVRMSASAITINLGLDDGIDLHALGLDCGYNVITTGSGTFEHLFRAHDRGEHLLDTNRFHCAVICPSLCTGGKPTLIIRVVPVPMANWKQLRENWPEKYKQEKDRTAAFYIKLVEKHLIPGLGRHIVHQDVCTPATYERYTGSPTGSNYDMAPHPDNFGLKRLKMRTPVKNLYQPKFSHGIWPSLQAGLQVCDMILQGRIMKGYSRYRAGRT